MFITRRCTQREFLLRPDALTNNLFTYALAEAAQRFNIVVVLSQMMSNHHHTIVYDPFGNQVDFRQRFHRMVAAAQNSLRGRWENLWAAEEPSVVELLSTEDLLEKLVYVATNPVKDGLVERVHHWPGPKFVPAFLSGTPIKAVRPAHFFRRSGQMRPQLDLELGLPDHFEDKEEFLAKLRLRVREVEERCAAERQRTGRRVLGRRAVLRQSWRSRPISREPRRGLRPRFAARDSTLREAIIEANSEWRAKYQAARLLWLAGFDVAFPYGTYWLRRYARVVVEPAPRLN